MSVGMVHSRLALGGLRINRCPVLLSRQMAQPDGKSCSCTSGPMSNCFYVKALLGATAVDDSVGGETSTAPLLFVGTDSLPGVYATVREECPSV
jgi:hypothetical protein